MAVNSIKSISKSACLAILILLSRSTPSRAQRPDLRFDRISIEEGLSQSGANCVLQGERGFMWFGTGYGLNKFDGINFTKYIHDPDLPNSLSSNDIRALYEDETGVLWIGTRGGLNRFNRDAQTFTHWRNEPDDPQSLSNDWVVSIYEDASGVLWIGTRGGLNQFDRTKGTFSRYLNDPGDAGSLSHDDVRAISEDEAGMLWIGTRGGLNKLDRELQTFTHWRNEPGNPQSLSHDDVQTILFDRSGDLWIGTKRGLNRLDREAQSFTRWLNEPDDPHSLSNDDVRAIREDESGSLWIGTWGGGIHRLDRERNEFVHWVNDPSNPNSLSDNSVFSIYEDRTGIIWVGTVNGVNKFHQDQKDFVHWASDPGNPNSLSHNFVFSICEDRSGVLWIGTDGGGLNEYDRETETFKHWMNEPGNPHSLSHAGVFSIHEDRRGILWIGTKGGLNRFDRQNESFAHWVNEPGNPQSLSNNEVLSVYEDRAGALWIGTRGGLNRFDREEEKFTRWVNEPGNPESLSNDVVVSIFEDRSGSLWIGTNGGLNRYEREADKFTRWLNEPGDPGSLGNNEVLSIYEDRSGTLWIGTTGGGLNRLDRDRGTFRRYKEKEGLPNDVIYGILEDEKGYLWLSTNKGVSRFDTRAETFRNFDAQDGLPFYEFNQGAHLESRGKLYFGGIGGLIAFLPVEIRDNPNTPPIVITAFKKHGEVARIDLTDAEEIRLSYQEDYFSFEFAALDYRNPKKNRYAYRMEGLHEEWVDSGARNYATYTRLDPGGYIFRVKGSNNDGVWNEKGASVKISITPPFWRSWWFRLLTVVSIVGFFVLWHRIRVRNIETHRKELEVQVAKRTREIADKNRQLESAFQDLKDTQAQLAQAEKMASLGNLAAGIAHEINSPVGAVKSAANTSQRSIEKVIEALEGSNDLEKTRGDRNFRMALEILKTNSDIIVMGSERINRIIHSLRNFARLEEADFQEADIHEGIESTLTLLHHQLKNRIKVVRQFGSIPKIQCYPNQLNQVFMNMLVNASQAIEHLGTITIRTSVDDGRVVVGISDDGTGIKRENLKRIFDPGFTTKGVGVGTGLGLSISYNIIKNHNGEIRVESEPGKGTAFTITLPIKQEGHSTETRPVA